MGYSTLNSYADSTEAFRGDVRTGQLTPIDVGVPLRKGRK